MGTKSVEFVQRIRYYAYSTLWRVDERYIRVKGRWKYLYRAVDNKGCTILSLSKADYANILNKIGNAHSGIGKFKRADELFNQSLLLSMIKFDTPHNVNNEKTMIFINSFSTVQTYIDIGDSYKLQNNTHEQL